MNHPTTDRLDRTTPHWTYVPAPTLTLDLVQSLLDVVGDVLEDGMDDWSFNSPDDGADSGWEVVEDDYIPLHWKPAVTVTAREADFDTISAIATPVLRGLRRDTARLAAHLTGIGVREHGVAQLSDETVICLRVDTMCDAPFGIDHEDGSWEPAPMPADGATFGADARLVISERLATTLRRHGIAPEAHGYSVDTAW